MKKYVFLVGGAVGFLLGSKAGTGPYMRVEKTVREVLKQPPIADVADSVTGTVERITRSEADSAPAPARAAH